MLAKHGASPAGKLGKCPRFLCGVCGFRKSHKVHISRTYHSEAMPSSGQWCFVHLVCGWGTTYRKAEAFHPYIWLPQTFPQSQTRPYWPQWPLRMHVHVGRQPMVLVVSVGICRFDGIKARMPVPPHSTQSLSSLGVSCGWGGLSVVMGQADIAAVCVCHMHSGSSQNWH